MKVQELVNLINAETDELLDTDEDHIPYINHALDVLAYTLAGTYAPDLLRSIDVHDGDDVPTDFASLVPPNGYPLGIIGQTFHTQDGGDVTGVKYQAMWPHISLVCQCLAFNRGLPHQEEDLYSCRVLRAG